MGESKSEVKELTFPIMMSSPFHPPEGADPQKVGKEGADLHILSRERQSNSVI